MNFLRKIALTVANEAQLLATTSAITNISAEIPTNEAKLAAHILTLSISPMSALSICTWLASRPWSSHFHTFPGSLCLNRLDGTSATAAQCILLEGFIRPADWTYHSDYKQRQFPTFGAYALGMEVAISDSFPAYAYAALDLLDGASKKGQLPCSLKPGIEGNVHIWAFRREVTTWLSWRYPTWESSPRQRSTSWRTADTRESASSLWPGTSFRQTLSHNLRMAQLNLFLQGYRRELTTMKGTAGNLRQWRPPGHWGF